MSETLATLKKQLQTLSGSYMEQLIRANKAEAENKELRKRIDQLKEQVEILTESMDGG